MIQIVAIESPVTGSAGIVFIEVKENLSPAKILKQSPSKRSSHARLDKEIPYPP